MGALVLSLIRDLMYLVRELFVGEGTFKLPHYGFIRAKLAAVCL